MSAISVIIPAYNHAAFVGEAIQSVLGQSFRDLELVVVDDGSTDATQAVLGKFQDPRLRVIRQANAGLLAARSAGVSASGAPLVTFLDADDVFLPDNLATKEQYLREHPDVGLVAGGVRYIDSVGRILGEEVAAPAGLEVVDLLLHNPITVSGVLLRRTWFERVDGFATGRVYDACGDWHLWLRLRAAGCPFGWVERAGVSYRIQSGQMSQDPSGMRASMLAVLDSFFSQPDLPTHILAMRNRARAAALVKLAARAYHADCVQEGARDLAEAVRLDPGLAGDGYHGLVTLLAGWAYCPLSEDAEAYLHKIARHLPASLRSLRRPLRWAAAAAALRPLFEGSRDTRRARRGALLRAIWNDPSWLLNRGVVRMLVDAWIPFGR